MITSGSPRLEEMPNRRGYELTAGSDPQATAEMEGWVGVSHRLLAGGGESRRALHASDDPEVIMIDAFPDSTLIAHRKALEAAAIAVPLVARVPAPLKCLANMVIRSASSVPANLAEGHGRSGRDRMYHWRIAYESAKEVDTHLRLLAHAKAIDASGAETAVFLFDEVRAMTCRLLHPRT